MANFKFKHAVMSAGKSRELARIHYTYKQKNQYVVVIVPSTDNRNGEGFVTARSGEQIRAFSVNPGDMRRWFGIFLKGMDELYGENQKIDCILIDEVQFFTQDDLFAIKELACLENNIPVIAFGLKSDFKNEMFEGSSAAMIVAEYIEEIETICAFCNEKAIMNLRFQDNNPIREGEQIQIGDEEYRPVCHKHYLDDGLRIQKRRSIVWL